MSLPANLRSDFHGLTNPRLNYFRAIKDADGCPPVSAASTLTVSQRPTAVVSGSKTICKGDSAQIQAALTGTGPWKVTWSDGIDAKGRPILIAGQDPTADGNKSCPAAGGGHNWQATTFNVQTGWYYFTTTEGCQTYYKNHQEFREGLLYTGSTGSPLPLDPQDVSRGSKGAVLGYPGGGRLSVGTAAVRRPDDLHAQTKNDAVLLAVKHIDAAARGAQRRPKVVRHAN